MFYISYRDQGLIKLVYLTILGDDPWKTFLTKNFVGIDTDQFTTRRSLFNQVVIEKSVVEEGDPQCCQYHSKIAFSDIPIFNLISQSILLALLNSHTIADYPPNTVFKLRKLV